MLDSPFLVRPEKKLRLRHIDPDDTSPFKDHADAESAVQKNLLKLEKFQEVLYAQQKYAVLIVFQAMDTGGKDGAIKHIFSGINPQGCAVTSFKVPSEEQLAHDYLWRVHQAAPRRGMIGIFNRSHYESVLVERVRKLVPRKTWHRRYGQINSFEKLLSDEGTVILKFFLHISKSEQKKRLEDRLEDRHKHWKFSASDLPTRKLWEPYQQAYQDALEKCSTEYAPWYTIPSNHKWFRNWAISDLLVRTLGRLDLKYPEPMKGLDKIVIS